MVKRLARFALLDLRSQLEDCVESTLRVNKALTFLEFGCHLLVLLLILVFSFFLAGGASFALV